MTTTILERKIETEELSMNDFLNQFRNTLEATYNKQNEIEELTELMAKNPVDKFIITEAPNVAMCQGDIIIWSENTDEYKENIGKVRDLKETDRMILQEGDSITGDHELVPVSNAKYTLKTGKFVPAIIENVVWRNNAWDCKILEIDSPFVLKHREHGNMTFLTPGKYMFCSQLESKTLEKVKD